MGFFPRSLFKKPNIKLSPKVLFSANPLQQIPFAEKPLNLGGALRFISPEEFKKIFNTDWREDVEIAPYCDSALFAGAKESIVSGISRDELVAQVSTLRNKPETRIALCKINEKAGYGAFAINEIAINSVVAIYPGCINDNKLEVNRHYAFRYHGSEFFIDPKKFRGIASFFQHLPEPLPCKNPEYIDVQEILLKMHGQNISKEQIMQTEELFCIEFQSENIYTTMATANLRCEYLLYDNVPLMIFVTTRKIIPGEQLGFNYGYTYWSGKGYYPEYFDRDGNIIPHHLYRRTFGSLNIDGFNYVGDFQKLIQLIEKDNSTLFCPLQNATVEKIVSKISIAEALLNACAITEEEYETYTFKPQIIPLNDFILSVEELLSLFEKTILDFNSSHCQMNDINKGYWRASHYKRGQPEQFSQKDYATGLINSPYFIKTDDFCFNKKQGVSSYDACASLISDEAFGIIDDHIWALMCNFLTLIQYLDKDIFDVIFPHIVLSKNALITSNIFNFFNERAKNIGGLICFNNTNDYEFRHPFSDYENIHTLQLASGFFGFGFDRAFNKQKVDDLLKEEYYKEQSPEEIDYIQQVSANHLLEYPTKVELFETTQYGLTSSNLYYFSLLKTANHLTNLDSWIKSFRDQIHINVLEVFCYGKHKNKFLINIFNNNYWWQVAFNESEYLEEESYRVPRKDYKFEHMFLFEDFSFDNLFSPSQYNMGKRSNLPIGKELSSLCSSIIVYFLNANFFENNTNFQKAFELVQKLRNNSIVLGKTSQKIGDNHHIDLTKEEDNTSNLASFSSQDLEKIKSELNGRNTNQAVSLFQKHSFEKEKKECCYQIGLPPTASEQEIGAQKKVLLRFWHPDKNKSIIADQKSKEISGNAARAIKLDRKLQKLEAELKKLGYHDEEEDILEEIMEDLMGHNTNMNFKL